MQSEFESILKQLKALINRPSDMPIGIPKIQQNIWGAMEATQYEPQWEILRDLAYVFEFYQPGQRARSEDKSLYGEERALSEIIQALEKLKLQGERES